MSEMGRPEGASPDPPDRRSDGRSGWPSTRMRRAIFWLVALGGVLTVLLVLLRTDDDPIAVIISAWPVVVAAASLYTLGMVFYARSWANLFESDRRALQLGFLISQPIKYMPGGVAQPLGQIALGVESTGRTAAILVAFPVHVLINVVAAATLGAPFLLLGGLSSWVRWLVLLTPLLWALLDRRWMVSVLERLGRLISRFRVVADLPAQALINRAFLWALAAHGLMFTSFGVLTASAIPGWSVVNLTFGFAVAWLVGYVVIPSPAGLGAREAALVVILGGTLTTAEVVGITVVHRVMTMILELGILLVAVWLSRRPSSGRGDQQVMDGRS